MLSVIVAHGKNGVIGKGNKLIWHLPNDLAFFKRMTVGKTIIMGRNTFESIGRVLPDRRSVVLTRNKEAKTQGVEYIHDLSELSKYKKRDCYIIGGAEVYKKALAFADYLYVTYINETFDGDAFFPEIKESEWSLIQEVQGIKDEKNPYEYTFRMYKRTLP